MASTLCRLQGPPSGAALSILAPRLRVLRSTSQVAPTRATYISNKIQLVTLSQTPKVGARLHTPKILRCLKAFTRLMYLEMRAAARAALEDKVATALITEAAAAVAELAQFCNKF